MKVQVHNLNMKQTRSILRDLFCGCQVWYLQKNKEVTRINSDYCDITITLKPMEAKLSIKLI